MLRDLEVQNAVLVSPSLSGSYALPFLMRTHHQLRGFVPIAPTSTRNYTQEQFWAVKVLRQWSAKILVPCPCPCPWLVPHGGGLRGLAPEVAWKGWSVGARGKAPQRNSLWVGSSPSPQDQQLLALPCRPQLLSCMGNWTTPWRENHFSSSTTCPTTLW